MSNLLDPPSVLLTWTATALGAAFDAYRVWRRPARATAFGWVQVAEIDVPAGYDRATVEARHNAWIDYAAGWAAEAGPYVDGWDYAVTVANWVTGLESAVTDATAAMVQVPPAETTWLVSNAAPWLNSPLATLQRIAGEDLDQVDVHRPAGRDGALTRARAELPPRQWGLSWRHLGFVGEDPARPSRAARASARQMTVLTARGDRFEGSLISGQLGQSTELAVDAEAVLVETGRDPALAQHNLPCGVVLDGANDYATTADTDGLDPGASEFTVVVAAAFADGGTALSKGNLGTSDGYGIRRNSAGSLQFFVDGAASGGPAHASADWFDGTIRVASGDSTGTAQRLFLDGALVANDTVNHGPITTDAALAAGANNGGASGKMACAPLQAWAVYMRRLSTAEHQAAANYLLGRPGWRMPAGPAVFFDLRDDRCWDGIVQTVDDLAGSALTASLVSTPPTRGIPWPLDELDRWS